MQIINKRKLIPVIMTAALVLAAVFFAYKNKHSLINVSVIDEISYEAYKDGKAAENEIPALYFNGELAVYDNEIGCYILSVSEDKGIKGKLYAEGGKKIYFKSNNYTANPSLLTRESGIIQALIVGKESFFEGELRFTTLPVIALDNLNTEINENSGTITVTDTENTYKLYKIAENDGTYIREALSFEIWNLLCNKSLKKDYSIVRVYCNKSYAGLYIKSLNNPGKKIDITKELPDEDAFSDYLLYLQVIYGYNNVNDHYHLVKSSKNTKILPTRIKYSLGNYSDSMRYLSYNEENRVISSQDFGIEDTNYIKNVEELTKEKYLKYRENLLSDENLQKITNSILNRMDNSGQISSYSSFDVFAGESEALRDYFVRRMDGLDKYYGIKAVEDEIPEISDFEEIYVLINDKNISRIKLYIDNQGAVVFLPGIYRENTVTFEFDSTIYDVSIDEKNVDLNGRTIDVNKEHDITIIKHSGDKSAQITTTLSFMRSDDIPVVFMDNANGNTEYLFEEGKKHTHTEPGNILCVNPDGNIDYEGQIDEIRYRGHTSYGMSKKKSYQIKLIEDASIFSMGKAKKWIIQANHYDKTRIRNHLVYDMCRKALMDGAVDDKYADVYLNGEYLGNFIICEKPEVYPGRVSLKPDGYYFETTEPMRLKSTYYGIEADGISYRIRYPEAPSDEKRYELIDALENLKNSIDTSSADECGAVFDRIDVDSFADMFLINHMTNHMDANRFSTYYRYQDGQMIAGPAWDYDQAFDNNLVDNNLEHYKNIYRDGWPEYLYKFKDYQEICANKWNKVYKPYFEKAVEDGGEIDTLIGEMEASILMDYRVNHVGSKTDLENETNKLKEAINDRISLMDEIVSHQDDFLRIEDKEGKCSYWKEK